MIDIAGVFAAIDTSSSVAKLLGIVESIEDKVDRLIGSELNTAIRTLDQARASVNGESELLYDARRCFTKAIELETGYRRGLAWLGCAVCHHLLGDTLNRDNLLTEIVLLDPPKVELRERLENGIVFGIVVTGTVIRPRSLSLALAITTSSLSSLSQTSSTQRQRISRQT